MKPFSLNVAQATFLWNASGQRTIREFLELLEKEGILKKTKIELAIETIDYFSQTAWVEDYYIKHKDVIDQYQREMRIVIEGFNELKERLGGEI